MSLAVIDACVERAGNATPLIRPIKINGENKFLMFLHDYQVTDMRTKTDSGQWLDIQKAALAGRIRSKSPIYTGAPGEYNNTNLHKWNCHPMRVSNPRVPHTPTPRGVFFRSHDRPVASGTD